jgi:quercetin dioxygenase-like cupin family protein
MSKLLAYIGEGFMPIVRAGDTVVHDLHGSRFTSYTAPSLGSKELCAWRLDVPAGTEGVPHTVTKEEIVFILSGTLDVSLTPAQQTPQTPQNPQTLQTPQTSGPGDAVVVPPGTTLRIANLGDEPASAWVTTSAGLVAVLADGTRLTPPWAR